MPPKWSPRKGITTILIVLVIVIGFVVWNLISNQPTKPVKEPKDGWATILPQAQHWKLRSSDTFETENEFWQNGSQRTSLADRKLQIVDGKYRVEVLARYPLTAHLGPGGASTSTNFYIAVDGSLVGTGQGVYGLAFHAARIPSSQEYYGFFIIGDAYSFQVVKDDNSRMIIDWTETPAIQFGQMNHVAVVGAGSHYVFFINDQYVDEASDDELGPGGAGVLISMDKSDDTLVLEFRVQRVIGP